MTKDFHGDDVTGTVTSPGMDPLVGQVLDGRFKVVEPIGTGGMGRVYRAVQQPLNRAVALKVLDYNYGAGKDEAFRQRFLVEAALTAKLSHPNTITVIDYGCTPHGIFYIAMEYLDGRTLDQVVTDEGPIEWRRVLNIGQQVCRSLREAHNLGVVHRDLKPGNVMLLHADDDTDQVKVLDFGLVKSFVVGQELEGRAITQQGMLMGSPPYMAPEQGEKNRADPRSDIYSLGTMLFEMLTGKPPFSGGGALEVILKHVHQPVPAIVAPSKFEAVPEALQAIVMRCLAKSPMDRFQAMDELLIALQDVPVPSRNIEPEAQPKTEAAVPVTLPPPQPVVVMAPAPPSRGPSVLLVGGFFVAAVAGVLGTWAAVKPAAPTKLVFHVESNPIGADVVVEGKKLGVTPIDLEQLLGQGDRASLELRLEKEGFAPANVRLTGGGGRLEVSQTLSLLPVPVVQAPVQKVEPMAAASVAVAAPVVSSPPPRPSPEVRGSKFKKKTSLVSAPPVAPAAPRPVSKLDEEDEPGPARSELKRPTAQP